MVKLTTNSDSGKPFLSWNAVKNASRYELLRSTDGKNFTQYDSTAKAAYTNISTNFGSTYYYQVKAICATSSYGNSAVSAAASIKVP